MKQRLRLIIRILTDLKEKKWIEFQQIQKIKLIYKHLNLIINANQLVTKKMRFFVKEKDKRRKKKIKIVMGRRFSKLS